RRCRVLGVYLAGTNTRRFKGALAPLRGGPLSKDAVSRLVGRLREDFDTWSARDLADEDIVFMDGWYPKVRIGGESRAAAPAAAKPSASAKPACASTPEPRLTSSHLRAPTPEPRLESHEPRATSPYADVDSSESSSPVSDGLGMVRRKQAPRSVGRSSSRPPC